MTAVEIIEAIRRLPREEQIKVVHLARQVIQEHRLTPQELGSLAERMVDTPDPAEAELRDEIIRGFYGGESHA